MINSVLTSENIFMNLMNEISLCLIAFLYCYFLPIVVGLNNNFQGLTVIMLQICNGVQDIMTEKVYCFFYTSLLQVHKSVLVQKIRHS